MDLPFFYPCFFREKKIHNPRRPGLDKCEGLQKGGIDMAEVKLGEVVKFFAKPSVAAVKIVSGELQVGDTIRITGHTTDLTESIESMEVNNQKVPKAVAGDFIGIKVSDRVRPGDEVSKVVPD